MDDYPYPSLSEMFVASVARDPHATALWHHDGTKFVSETWRDLHLEIKRWATTLYDFGVEAGDRVALLSENRREWVLNDLSVHWLGAIHVALHSVLSGAQAIQQLCHCHPRIILISNAAQLEKLVPFAAQIPIDATIATFEQVPSSLIEKFGGREVFHWKDAIANSCDRADEFVFLYEAAETCSPDTVASILYTSGTTGAPKGITLTHGNLISNAFGIIKFFSDDPTDRRLCFLPLSHIFGRMCDHYIWLARGSQLALARSRETILADCQATQPTIINGVPIFWERIHRELEKAGKADVPESLQALLGGRVRACCSGGAPLDVDTFDFFQTQGIPLLQGYGLSETSPAISISTLEHNRRGASGKPLPGVDVRIAEDGEICTRGPHVMPGYWKDDAATHAVIQDGWFHTGDLGRVDEDGFVFITGRKKELIVLANGRNIIPTLLESLLCRDPLILQAMVVGDKRSQLGALIVPDADALRQWVKDERLWAWSKKGVLNHQRVHELYRERIAYQLRELSPAEQVHRFFLLDRGFTQDAGHLTPKFSLRRNEIAKDFAAEIDKMYD
ncbi:MAG: AMP-binding protein [Pirellulaceae bacterium]|nr:AMP-binding protein [Planctomycetales bacterium]